MVNRWIKENINEIYKICKNVSKSNDWLELCQHCIEYILINKNFNEIKNDNEKLYFFARVVRNNYQSKTSSFYYTHKKFHYNPITTQIEVEDIPYSSDEFDLSWVENQLKELKKTNMWYYGRIFELYIEENCNLTRLSRRTTIPQNSLSRDINKVRKILNNKRKKIIEHGM